MANSQSTKKHSRPVVEDDKQLKDDAYSVMETHQAVACQQMWKQKRPCFQFQGSNDSFTAFGPMKSMLTADHNNILHFQSATRLADWVFDTAKRRPMQLHLSCSERNEEVREALLRQFHRWPEAKVSRAAEQYQTMCQKAEDQCQNQVKLYIEELRGKLQAGAKALFWLNVLQPAIHPAPLSRQEAQEVLLLLLEELKSVIGVYEQLMMKSEPTWDALTLPLKLTMPLKLDLLCRSVMTLTRCEHGHKIAKIEANRTLAMLAMFAEQNALFSKRKRTSPLGLFNVAFVDRLAQVEISSFRDLPEAFCKLLSHLFLMLMDGWSVVVDGVLDGLGRSLASRWVSCERASFETVFKSTVEHDLQSDFARLRHVLATGQLYAMQKVDGVRSSTDKECLYVSILHSRGLLVVQLNCSPVS